MALAGIVKYIVILGILALILLIDICNELEKKCTVKNMCIAYSEDPVAVELF